MPIQTTKLSKAAQAAKEAKAAKADPSIGAMVGSCVVRTATGLFLTTSGKGWTERLADAAEYTEHFAADAAREYNATQQGNAQTLQVCKVMDAQGGLAVLSYVYVGDDTPEPAEASPSFAADMVAATRRILAGQVRAELRARDVALAWLNASIASGDNPDRAPLYKSLAIEFFANGVQFVGCDGVMLLRTWAPLVTAIGESPAPDATATPYHRIVVRDESKFARTFFATVLAATAGDLGSVEPLELAVELAPEIASEPAMDDALRPLRLAIRTLKQELHLPLWEGEYPAWRSVGFGLQVERVAGLRIASWVFAALGKVKGASAWSLEFNGAAAGIRIESSLGVKVHGVVMPMEPPREKKKPAASDEDDMPDLDGFEEAEDDE